jgi:hypothetical protein
MDICSTHAKTRRLSSMLLSCCEGGCVNRKVHGSRSRAAGRGSVSNGYRLRWLSVMGGLLGLDCGCLRIKDVKGWRAEVLAVLTVVPLGIVHFLVERGTRRSTSLQGHCFRQALQCIEPEKDIPLGVPPNISRGYKPSRRFSLSYTSTSPCCGVLASALAQLEASFVQADAP